MPYFYRHSEGTIIEKPALVVDRSGGPSEYFSGPFVREWWFENDLLRPLNTAPPTARLVVPLRVEQVRRMVGQ